MNGMRQDWLVTRRELRERARSRAFFASVALMAVAVAAMLIIPALFKPGGGTKNIGLTGPQPSRRRLGIDRPQRVRVAGVGGRQLIPRAWLAGGRQEVIGFGVP